MRVDAVRQQPHEREAGHGLAATAFAHQSDALAGRDVEGHVARYLQPAGAGLERDGQVPDGEEGWVLGGIECAVAGRHDVAVRWAAYPSITRTAPGSDSQGLP